MEYEKAYLDASSNMRTCERSEDAAFDSVRHGPIRLQNLLPALFIFPYIKFLSL